MVVHLPDFLKDPTVALTAVSCSSLTQVHAVSSSMAPRGTIILGPQFNHDAVLAANGTVLVAGWVRQPDGRGTLDILWSSVFTIFLCTWTVLCLNLPHRRDTEAQKFLRRAKWMFCGILGPELVLAVAIGQWASARRSVVRFKSMGCPQWTIRHGFFADMGGVLLQPRDSTPFLVNARQLAYLVQHRYAQFSDITEAEIWDRSKADTVTKAMTIVQASWLAIQIVGRAICHLPTTTLELSAVAIVFCTLGTFYFWLHKPSDLQKGIVISIPYSTSEILIAAGPDAAQPYLHTPLDFIGKQSPTCSYDIMKFFQFRCDDRERPLQRFPNDRFPDISTFEKFALFMMTLTYAALHLIGWNFPFPTRTERTLWRIAAWFITGTTFVFWIFETVAARQRFGRWDKYFTFLKLKRPTACGLAKSRMMTADFKEMEQKAAKPMPSTLEASLIMPVAVLYVVARVYQVVEVFLSLRLLPARALDTVQVANIIPHW